MSHMEVHFAVCWESFQHGFLPLALGFLVWPAGCSTAISLLVSSDSASTKGFSPLPLQLKGPREKSVALPFYRAASLVCRVIFCC